MTAHWDTPEQEEAAQYLVGVLNTAAGTGLGVAIFPDDDGWSVVCVGQGLADTPWHETDLPAAELAEADGLHHALAVAKRKLARIASDVETRQAS